MSSGSPSVFLKRITHYCAKAERCTQDVIQKLTSWDVPEEDMDDILENLRVENYLDDIRYASSFVADKWKLDLWGRGKIKNGLFQKGFSALQIETALETIDPDAYFQGLKNLLFKKADTLKDEDTINQMKKLLSFGQSRGFEDELIWQWLEAEGFSFDNITTPGENDEAF